MKSFKGRVLNPGRAKGEALVFNLPFSFIGDMSPKTGEITMVGHPNFGMSVKNKVLVFQTGRGGTIAPYMLYEAVKNNVGPCAILCDNADMLTLECALTVDIPIYDAFGEKITEALKNGDMVELKPDGTCYVR
ncbi:MAG TPA: DUF126 domain-containing protein [Christensenellaceae bacterium]|jgi:predicted aconitase with swiveling domain|nr:DUF126 domain-containing protein [Christensenellaceae bacterium]